MEIKQPLGYLATPEYGNGTGILVLHPWWGLNDTMRSICTRLAGEGYTVFAPDLYHGEVATTIEGAEALSQELNEEQAMVDVSDAVEYLSGHDDVTSSELGVIGFSLGAYYALSLSVDDPQRVRAVVLFYGTGEGDFARSRAAYLGHFSQNDEYEPATFVLNLEQALRAAGRPVTFYPYEDTGHWFFEQDRPDAYQQEAAQLAWERTVSFLKETLQASIAHDISR